MFNLIEELFAPGRKHTDEERKRLELTRVDLNDGDPGKGPIDLTSGQVVVRVPAQSPAEDDGASGGGSVSRDDGTSGGDDPQAKSRDHRP
ncbi:hypothetical protein DY218_02610 [Streptomyces triticagri]|uniref:Regulatory protein n=1 Tax=Streptomyces triticagri TaxID=2293568 RepID=A0A372MB76_9ACTN|nr:DUF6191 domain-containing protein [Streptomyces triticagri]RFU88198.1 hypothetical protein DY218_02610 [Streptomyces triticagri]